MTETSEASHAAPVKDKDPPLEPKPERQKMQVEEVSWRQPPPHSTFDLPPYYQDPDPEAPEYFDDMAVFYLEAARRLPIAQMPKLACYLSLGGLLLGLNNPVTNIIVNAIYLMGSSRASDALPAGVDPVRHAADRASYVDIARKSRAALVVFMTFYFRHLTQAQAKRYLRAARHDLALAIGLVEWHRNAGGFELSPDCSRTRTALRYAAKVPMLLDDPHDLVQLLASRFPCHLLDPVLDDLRRGGQLSVGRVNDILNLLRHPWSPPPPPLPAPTPGTFHDADGNVTIIANIGQDLFSTTTITRHRAATLDNNKHGDFVTTTTISRHPSRPNDDNDDLAAAAYLTTGSDTKSRLCSFLNSTTALQLQPDTNSLKMCLLDTIHALYIQALAMLPSDHQPRLLRAMLAGGHCYGVMEDPVSNIVVNSIWYNARFPDPQTANEEDEDFLITSSRAESSSLHGLIAILRADRGVTEQEAVACLRDNLRNLSHLMSSLNHQSLAAAAEAAKHPQPAALVAFLTTLLTPEKGDHLRSLLTNKNALSNADFKDLNTMIAGNDVAAAPVQIMAATPNPGRSALNTMPGATGPGGMSMFSTSIFNKMPAALVQTTVPDRGPKSYVRTKVEELLLDYGRNYPLGPRYKLCVICGMASKSWYCFRGTTCYHVNFLASTLVPNDDATTSPPPECRLFFTEFWTNADDGFESSKKPPVCCPIQDYHAFPGRCFICECALVRIVHPPCGNYFLRQEYSTDSLCAITARHAEFGE
ncbi:uncharacterized protein [Lolium perenne]|uniref:uncharacterized protein n=1 Tax=Lolium perenne TaxID=4522 RepID=UPI0021EB4E2E|nr:uncharacterized protein LOC127291986 [Lolium perenne]